MRCDESDSVERCRLMKLEVGGMRDHESLVSVPGGDPIFTRHALRRGDECENPSERQLISLGTRSLYKRSPDSSRSIELPTQIDIQAYPWEGSAVTGIGGKRSSSSIASRIWCSERPLPPDSARASSINASPGATHHGFELHGRVPRPRVPGGPLGVGRDDRIVRESELDSSEQLIVRRLGERTLEHLPRAARAHDQFAQQQKRASPGASRMC